MTTATPKPRVMLQPRKDELRRQLEVAAAQIAYLLAERELSIWARLLSWWRG